MRGLPVRVSRARSINSALRARFACMQRVGDGQPPEAPDRDCGYSGGRGGRGCHQAQGAWEAPYACFIASCPNTRSHDCSSGCCQRCASLEEVQINSVRLAQVHAAVVSIGSFSTNDGHVRAACGSAACTFDACRLLFEFILVHGFRSL